MRRKSKFMLGALVALSLVAAACGDDDDESGSPGATGEGADGSDAGEPSGDPLVIAVLAPTTGALALTGEQSVNGVELAVEEINANGGVDGRPLEVVAYDTKVAPEEAVAAYTRAVDSDGAVAVVGPVTTPEFLAVVPVAGRLQVPFMSGGVATTAATRAEGNDYTFRSTVVNVDIAAKNVEMAETYGCERVAIIHDDGGYGLGYQGEVAPEAEEAGVEVVTTQSIGVSATDTTAQLQSVRSADADCVLIGASAGGTVGLVLRQAVELGMDDLTFIGPSSLLQGDTFTTAGDALGSLDVYALQALDVDKPRYVETLERYVGAFGDEPTGEYWAATYDATNLFALALAETGGESGPALVEALEALGSGDYESVNGKEGAGTGFGPDDHDWLSEDYLVEYKVLPGEEIEAVS